MAPNTCIILENAARKVNQTSECSRPETRANSLTSIERNLLGRRPVYHAGRYAALHEDTDREGQSNGVCLPRYILFWEKV